VCVCVVCTSSLSFSRSYFFVFLMIDIKRPSANEKENNKFCIVAVDLQQIAPMDGVHIIKVYFFSVSVCVCCVLVCVMHPNMRICVCVVVLEWNSNHLIYGILNTHTHIYTHTHTHWYLHTHTHTHTHIHTHNMIIIKGDITRQSTAQKIISLFGGQRAELVVCDGAPDGTYM